MPKHAWHNMHVSRRNVTKNPPYHTFLFHSITSLFKKFKATYHFHWGYLKGLILLLLFVQNWLLIFSNTKYFVSVTKHDVIKMGIFTYDTYSCYTVCLTQFTNTLLRSYEVYTHFSSETRNILNHVLHRETLWIDWLGSYRCYVSNC